MLTRRSLIAGAAASGLILPKRSALAAPSPLRVGPNGIWFPGQVKPNGIPRIDWSHPLAKDLIFYAFDTGMGQVVDLAGGLPLTIFGAPSAASRYGAGANYNTTAFGGWSGPTTSPAYIQNAQGNSLFSIACAFLGYVPAAFDTIFGRFANGENSSPFLNWYFGGPSGASAFGFFLFFSGTLQDIGTQVTPTAGAFTSAGLCASGTALSSYYQGLLHGSTTGTVGNNTSDDTLGVAGWGNGAGGASPAFTMVYYGAMWKRALTTWEWLQLHLDPYCFLLPQEGGAGIAR